MDLMVIKDYIVNLVSSLINALPSDLIDGVLNNDIIMIALIIGVAYAGFKFVNTIVKFIAYALIIVYFASKLGIF